MRSAASTCRSTSDPTDLRRLPTSWRIDLRAEREYRFSGWTMHVYAEMQNASLTHEVVGWDIENHPLGSLTTGALDRACGMPSTGQDDICYWAAIAWLRAGDRPQARRALTDVLTRWPGSTHAGEASVALGWLVLEAGDRDAARARFAAAVNDRMPGVRAAAARGLAAAQ